MISTYSLINLRLFNHAFETHLDTKIPLTFQNFQHPTGLVFKSTRSYSRWMNGKTSILDRSGHWTQYLSREISYNINVLIRTYFTSNWPSYRPPSVPRTPSSYFTPNTYDAINGDSQELAKRQKEAINAYFTTSLSPEKDQPSADQYLAKMDLVTSETTSKLSAISPSHSLETVIKDLLDKHLDPSDDPQLSKCLFNNLLFTFGKSNRIDVVQELFTQMRIRDVVPDRLTYLTLLWAYGRKSHISLMSQVMTDMSRTIGVDLLAFHIYINAHANLNLSAHPETIFGMLRSFNLVETVETCNIILVNYVRAQESPIKLSETVWHWMQTHHIKPNQITYAAMIDCCEDDTDRALQFYQWFMQAARDGKFSESPDLSWILSNVLRRFSHASKTDQGFTFLQQFIDANPGYELTPQNHACIFELYIRGMEVSRGFEYLQDHLRQFINQRKPVPLILIKIVVEAIEKLPESILSENHADLKRWRNEKIKKINEITLEEFDIQLEKWRKVYIPRMDKQEGRRLGKDDAESSNIF